MIVNAIERLVSLPIVLHSQYRVLPRYGEHMFQTLTDRSVNVCWYIEKIRQMAVRKKDRYIAF